MRNDTRYSSRLRYDTGRMPYQRPYQRPLRRGMPLRLAIAADVLAAALLLLFFYITNYLLAPDVEGVPLLTPSVAASAPAGTASSAPSETTSAAATEGNASAAPTGQSAPPESSAPPAEPGSLRAKFADKFTSGGVEKTDASYKSANVSVSVDKVQENGVTYFVADIYLADAKYLKTAFGGGSDKLGQRGFVVDSLKAAGGIVGVNGDNCIDNPGLIIRNGVYYKKWTKTTADALVMYADGTMKTIPGGQLDMDRVKAEAPYQVWGFGPILLADGQPATKFNSSLKGDNPRTAIGYYEPGHYCFVDVDGRQPGYSDGYSLTELSQLFAKLGCKEAFNLDGGGSTQMAFQGNRISSPCSDYRRVGDMIYIADN